VTLLMAAEFTGDLEIKRRVELVVQREDAWPAGTRHVEFFGALSRLSMSSCEGPEISPAGGDSWRVRRQARLFVLRSLARKGLQRRAIRPR